MTAARPRLVVAYAAAPAHEVLRAEAARFHEVSPAAIVVVHECPRCGSDTHGRPRLLPTRTLRRPAEVSLARAGELSVVAVTDAGPVGVDVEIDGAATCSSIEGAALHPAERHSAPDDATCVWVRKEAILKAYGLGLAVDPRDVRLDADGLVAWDSDSDLPAPRAVWLRDLVVPGHVAAVVVLPSTDRDAAGLAVTMHPASP